MFTNKYLFFFAGALISFTSCKNEEVAQEYQSEVGGLTVSFADVAESANGLKTTLIDNKVNYVGSWMVNDTILITDFTTTSKYVTTVSGPVNAKLARVAGQEKVVIDGPKLAYYPGENATFNGVDGFDITLPSVQKYLEEGTVSDDAYPMMAKSNNGSLALYNLCGILKVVVTCDVPQTITNVKFKSRQHRVRGKGVATFEGEVPSLVMPSLSGMQSVSLDLGDGVVVGPEGKAFYIVLPPNTYSKGYKNDTPDLLNEVDITFKDAGERFYSLTEDLEIVRSKVTRLNNNIDIVVGSGIDGNPGDIVD